MQDEVYAVVTAAEESVRDIELNQSYVERIGYDGNWRDIYRINLLNGDFMASLSGIASAPKVKLTLFNSSGKALTSRNSNASGVAFTQDKLLTAGTYYVVVDSRDKGKTRGEYLLSVSGREFVKANQQWDDDALSAPVVNVGRDQTLISRQGLAVNEWVGFGDKRDFRQVKLSGPGRYQFATSGVTGPIKLTIAVLTDKGKLKTLKSISVKPNSKTTAISNLLLDRGTYYVSVEAPGAAKGQNSDYNLLLNGEVFHQANRADDNWQNLAPEYQLSISGDQPTVAQVLIDNEWVGYGDAKDFRKLTIENAGSYTFRFGNIAHQAKFTLYTRDTKGRLKTVTRLSVGSGEKSSKALLLGAGEYYLGVEASGASKAKNTNYDLYVFGQTFEHGNTTDNTFATARNLTLNEQLNDEWVGFGNAKDYFRFTGSGPVAISVAGQAKSAKVTLYRMRDNGSLQTVKKATIGNNGFAVLNGLDLSYGGYYLEVASADNGKGKKNTAYRLTIQTPTAAAFDACSQLTGQLAVDDAARILTAGHSLTEGADEPRWKGTLA